MGECLGYFYGLSNCLVRKFLVYFFFYIFFEWSCICLYFSLFSCNNGCFIVIFFNLEVMLLLVFCFWLFEIKVIKIDYLM